jgi:hypothetical protein
MRVVMVFFTLFAVSGAFAWNELRAIRHHQPATRVSDDTADVPEPPRAPAPPPSHATAPPPPLSTWRGALPFGGVPSAPVITVEPTTIEIIEQGELDDDAVEGERDRNILHDEEDRCPEDYEGAGDDGCPTNDGRRYSTIID